MTEKTKLTKPISWLFLLYFLILYGERIQSLIRAVAQSGFFPTPFDGLVNLTSLLSLSAGAVMLLILNRRFWLSLCTSSVPDYSALTVTSGVILVSGMVHTEFTIAPIQFASYGALFLGMILRTAELTGRAERRGMLWYSLIYLVMFSMAIPVVYHSYLGYAPLFHCVEMNVMLLLVLFFTLMLRRLFLGQGENLLLWIPFLVMVFGDAAVLAMRWVEEINLFVLIFAGISAAMFLVGKILFRSGKRKRAGRPDGQ